MDPQHCTELNFTKFEINPLRYPWYLPGKNIKFFQHFVLLPTSFFLILPIEKQTPWRKEENQGKTSVLRIRDGMFIPDPDFYTVHPGSRISNPGSKNSTK